MKKINWNIDRFGSIYKEVLFWEDVAEFYKLEIKKELKELYTKIKKKQWKYNSEYNNLREELARKRYGTEITQLHGRINLDVYRMIKNTNKRFFKSTQKIVIELTPTFNNLSQNDKIKKIESLFKKIEL